MSIDISQKITAAKLPNLPHPQTSGNTMRISHLALAGAMALGLAGCPDNQTEQTMLNLFEKNCTSVVAGTSFLVTVSSTIAGAPAIAPFSQTVGANAGPICDSALATVQAAVETINAAGGTAIVNVTTTTPSGKVSGRYKLSIAPGQKVTYIVPPNGSPLAFLGL